MMKILAASLTAFALAFSGAAIAQDKGKMDKGAKGGPAPVIKVLAENAKVVVTETTYAPGAVSSTSRAEIRVVRALQGGTLERTYTDGKKEQRVYKTGEVRINEPGPAYTAKNIGNAPIVLYVVRVK